MCPDIPSASISTIFPLEACSMISYLKLKIDSSWDNLAKIIAPSSGLPNLCHLLLCFVDGYCLLEAERLALLDAIRSRCKAGQLKMIETSFEEDFYPSHDIQTDIRAVIGDNVEMWVGKWSPLDLDYRYSFSGPDLPKY